MREDSPIRFQYHWSKYLKNWLVWPIIWCGTIWTACQFTGIPFTFWTFVLVITVQFVENVFEATFDERPINGPYRWRKKE